MNKNITVELGIAGSMKQILAELTAMVPQQYHPEWDARIQDLVAITKKLEAQKDDELTSSFAFFAASVACTGVYQARSFHHPRYRLRSGQAADQT